MIVFGQAVRHIPVPSTSHLPITRVTKVVFVNKQSLFSTRLQSKLNTHRSGSPSLPAFKALLTEINPHFATFSSSHRLTHWPLWTASGAGAAARKRSGQEAPAQRCGAVAPSRRGTFSEHLYADFGVTVLDFQGLQGLAA